MGVPAFLIVFARRHKRFSSLLWILLLADLLVWAVIFAQPRDNLLHLKFFAVGEGDAIFLRTPSRQKILIDGGRGQALLPLLSRSLPFYERTLDLLILTHPHADHLQGLLKVLEHYRVKRLLFNGGGEQNAALAPLQNLAASRKIPVWEGYRGEVLRLDPATELRVLWPLGRESLSVRDPNLTSLVLLLRQGEFSALLSSDLDALSQDFLGVGRAEDIEVFKVPHQGALGSLNESFLEEIAPKLAVISVGPNPYGHPAPRVLSAYAERKIPLLRTDRNGTVTILSDGRQWKYRVEKGKN